MNLFAEIRSLVIDCLTALQDAGALPRNLDFGNVAVEPPRDPAHGDMASNAAMVLAKPAGQKPRDIAQALAERLSADPRIAEAQVAGPGFLNLRFAPGIWQSVIPAAVSAGARFGQSSLGAGHKVNVEFVSANPTGPLHVGHTRGAVFGDALAGLLAFTGHAVTREYYINDGGAQVDVLARSAYERYREANGQEPRIAEGLYPGDYLVPVGQALKAQFGDSLLDLPEDAWLAPVREAATEAMMATIREDLAALGVHMDVYFSEKSLYGSGRIEAALAALESRDLVYRGVLEPPKGKTPEDWEPREQTLFRATEFGDDVDRPVKKSDGGWTYFAPDIAYHYDKLQRGFDQLIDVFGADHGGYVKRMKAAVAALSGDGAVTLDVKLCQLVRLYKDGAPFKMSKRAGTFVTLRDVLDEVGPDVTRFTMLTRKNDAALDFDFNKATEQSKDNPVWYVQYAHARAASLMRRGAAITDVDDAALAGADMTILADPAEVALAARIAEWPRLVEAAALAHEPHRIAFYLFDLAGALHALWNLGNERPELRFLKEDNPTETAARLALVRACAVVISAGLGILGVTPVDEMR
ncbi:MAG: arginine--tRNA ligase [Pseudomonadota bacterium]